MSTSLRWNSCATLPNFVTFLVSCLFSSSASNSGFYLNIEENNSSILGIYKTPVAAGRGSGGLKYIIDPGKPVDSILLYRMLSTDPGVMMPELSRNLQHEEAIPLIREWINQLK